MQRKRNPKERDKLLIKSPEDVSNLDPALHELAMSLGHDPVPFHFLDRKVERVIDCFGFRSRFKQLQNSLHLGPVYANLIEINSCLR